MSDPTMQRRGNGGGGDGGGMRTVECLRGRLLAERVASKAAKEEADQLSSRLDELEKKLSDEVKNRNKAEKRLRRAIKRLESLKILDVELSESSIGSLSSNGCSGHQPTEMEERNDAGSLSTVDSARSGPHGGEAKVRDGGDGDSAAGSSAGSCTQVNSSQDGSWFSVVSEQSGSGPCKGEENRMDPDDAKNCGSPEGALDVDHDSEREQQPAASNGSSRSEASYRDEDDDRLALVLVDHPHHDAETGGPRTEHGARAAELRAAAETNEEEKEESNKLAIVLADPQPRPDAKAETHNGNGNDVQSVLLTLRQVKEQLRYTIERKSEGLVAHRPLRRLASAV